MPEIKPGQIFASFIPHRNTPTVLAYLNENKVAAVLDTGSACEALISTGLLSTLMPTFKAYLKQTQRLYKDAQNGTLPLAGTIGNVKLQIGEFITTINLTVFENTAENNLLLGFPFLSGYDICVSKEGLAFKQDYRILRVQEKNVKQEIFLSEFVILEEGEQRIVNCTTQGELNTDFVCISSVHVEPETPVSKLRIYFQYQKLGKNGKLNVVISNPSSQTLILQSGKLVAHAEKLLFANGKEIESESKRNEGFKYILETVTANCHDRVKANPGMDGQHRAAAQWPDEKHKSQIPTFESDRNPKHMSEKLTFKNRTHTGGSGKNPVNYPRSREYPKPKPESNPDWPNKTRGPEIKITRKSTDPGRDNTSAGKIRGVVEFSDKASNATQVKMEDKLEQLEFGFDEPGVKERPITDEMINCQSENREDFNFIKALVYKYPEVSSHHAWDVQHAKASVINFKLKPGAVHHRHRELPVALRMKRGADQIIQRLLSLNLIRPSKSDWSSRILFLQKAGREKATRGPEDVAMQKEENNMEQTQLEMADIRIVIDYRACNLALEDNYVAQNIPLIGEILQTLRKTKYLTCIDLSQGFWSLAISKESSKICAFSYRNQLFEPCSLPQGIKSSPNHFQHHLTKIFGKEKLLVHGEPEEDGAYSGIGIYLDNLILHALTHKHYKELLTKFFETASKYRLKIKLQKSHFYITKKLILFGFLVDIRTGALSPDPAKAQAIERIPKPSTKRQVRAFCGAIGYFHGCVQHLNAMLGPLYKLGAHTSKWSWTIECQKSFDAAKRELALLPTVYLLNPQAAVWLITDACIQNHSCFRLWQWCATTCRLYPVGNFSHKLTKAETRYSQHQCELLACVLFHIKYFNYLAGTRVNWITDCAALLWASRAKNINSLVARWWMLLSQENLRVYALPATAPLLVLSDLLTRRQDAVQVTNVRLSKTDVDKIPIICWANLPPMTLAQADQVCTKNQQMACSISGTKPRQGKTD
jgi:hypothetical protein